MDPLSKTLAVVEAALEKKAYDLRVVQIAHLSSIADYFVIATRRSDIQVQAIARGIEERMNREGEHALSIDGVRRGHWVVFDYNDVVIHIFFEPTRDFYRLETNWSDAQEVPLPEPLRSQVRVLSSGASG